MATRSAAKRASGSTATKDVPGNQTPNTPDVNESEIARLTVDQLRGRLRRRGITGTADMRKDDLVKALVKALRDGRKTTGSRTGSGTSRTSGGTSGPRSRSGDGPRSPSRSRRGQEQPGNQTPNTPDVNESEIARLTVDQLRGRLRRRGITGTADMRKDDLVKALVKALREGRKTTRSRTSPASGGRGTAGGGSASTKRAEAQGRDSAGSPTARPDSPQAAELAEVERRAAELENVTPQAAEVEDVERRTAELEAAVSAGTVLPSPPADATADTPALPAPRTARRARVPDVPADLGPVDEVVTPEGTVLTPGSDRPTRR